MKLRSSKGEGVLRSVGDPPNGILVVVSDGAASFGFGVSPNWEPKDGPPTVPEGARAAMGVELVNSEGDHTEDVEIEDVIEAVADRDSASLLLHMGAGVVVVVVNAALPLGIESIERVLAFQREIRDGLGARWEELPE